MIRTLAPAARRAPVAFVVLLVASCVGVRGSGKVQSEQRPVDAFERLRVSGAFEVGVSLGQAPALEITGDDNLLARVETRVEDGELVIRAVESMRPSRPLVVKVSAQRLDRVQLSGAVTLRAGLFAGERLELQVSGAAEADLEGRVGEFTLNASGAARVRARSLQAERVRVDASGAVSAEVYATEALKAQLSGAGSVDCYGGPADVDKNVSGAGSITVHGE